MKWLRRFLVRLAVRSNPSLERLLTSAGGSIERLSEQVQFLRERNDDRAIMLRRERADVQEAFALANGGPWGSGAAPLEESTSPLAVKVKEGLADLELALEDRGWKREIAYSQMEFSRYGIQQLILIARLYFLKNPLIRRGVQVSAHYVFGRGFEISVKDDETASEILKNFLTDPRNMPEISHRGLVAKEESLHTDGNIFWSFFQDPADGSTVIRSIDPLEIQQIVCDPDDNSVPWYYKRQYCENTFNESTGIVIPVMRNCWYVALGFTPPAGVTKIGGDPIMKDQLGNVIPILHDKEGGLAKWKFGCPIVYAAIDWARAYRYFLEDWATITRALARFSWNVETTGGAPAIAALKSQLATTLGINTDMVEQNPPPVSASAFITAPGNKLTPLNTKGATTEPEQGRRVMLMVAAAFGLPETFFGDASTGSLATAQSLDRPTELKFLQAQERWREMLQRICQYVLSQSARAPKGKLREARAGKAIDTPYTVDVKFPSVLEHDITSRITAIVEAMTINGFECTGIDLKLGIGLLLDELGVEDVQTVLNAMFPEADYDMDRTEELAAAKDAKVNPPEPVAPPEPVTGEPPHPPGQRTAKPKRVTEAAIARAVVELRNAALKLQENGFAHK